MGLELAQFPATVSSAAGRGLCFSRHFDLAHPQTQPDRYQRAGLFVFSGGDFFGQRQRGAARRAAAGAARGIVYRTGLVVRVHGQVFA